MERQGHYWTRKELFEYHKNQIMEGSVALQLETYNNIHDFIPRFIDSHNSIPLLWFIFIYSTECSVLRNRILRQKEIEWLKGTCIRCITKYFDEVIYYTLENINR